VATFRGARHLDPAIHVRIAYLIGSVMLPVPADQALRTEHEDTCQRKR
jgi:hypothetical protein